MESKVEGGSRSSNCGLLNGRMAVQERFVMVVCANRYIRELEFRM